MVLSGEVGEVQVHPVQIGCGSWMERFEFCYPSWDCFLPQMPKAHTSPTTSPPHRIPTQSSCIPTCLPSLRSFSVSHHPLSLLLTLCCEITCSVSTLFKIIFMLLCLSLHRILHCSTLFSPPLGGACASLLGRGLVAWWWQGGTRFHGPWCWESSSVPKWKHGWSHCWGAFRLLWKWFVCTSRAHALFIERVGRADFDIMLSSAGRQAQSKDPVAFLDGRNIPKTSQDMDSSVAEMRLSRALHQRYTLHACPLLDHMLQQMPCEWCKARSHMAPVQSLCISAVWYYA